MKRKKISRRKSKRIFRKTASNPHPKNLVTSSRGGIRL